MSQAPKRPWPQAKVKPTIIATYSRSFSALDSAQAVYHYGTAEHSSRVSQICALLGKTLGLPDQDMEALRWIGILHDIGKLAVPVDVIRKPGPLSPGEWEHVKRHAVAGSDIVLAISPSLAPIALGIRAHHERWDGSGYPDGLEGPEIPLFGRVAAVADVFDALTHEREYRPGRFSYPEARALILDSAGRAFDPEVVRAFASIGHQGLTPAD